MVSSKFNKLLIKSYEIAYNIGGFVGITCMRFPRHHVDVEMGELVKAARDNAHPKHHTAPARAEKQGPQTSHKVQHTTIYLT